jgi:maltose O-acetyltransferase
MKKLDDVLLNVVAKSHLCPSSLRLVIYRRLGMKIGQSDIWPGVGFRGTRCSIGDGSWINHGAYFDCEYGDIVIGANVGVGMGVMFVTSSHQMGKPERRAGAIHYQPVKVEDGVWIGAHAVILPGCTIGQGSVIAAMAVVTTSCEPNGLYAGVPACRVRDL